MTLGACGGQAGGQDEATSVLVQGHDLETVAAAVRAVGGEITHELGIINAVGTKLTARQLRRLEASDDTLRIQPDRTAGVTGAKARKRAKRAKRAKPSGYDEKAWKKAEKRSKTIARDWEKAAEKAVEKAAKAVEEAEKLADKAAQERAKQAEADATLWEKTLKEWNKQWAKDAFLKGSKPTFFPGLVHARALHDEDVTGDGIIIAIVDTGLWTDTGLRQGGRGGRGGDRRIVASYDAQTGVEVRAKRAITGNDGNGHGSHVASIAVSSRKVGGDYNGIAPDAKLVVVKAFGDDGRGSYADVIRGLDWVLQNHKCQKIRVLNLSFSAPARSHYWDDPINQAVMRLWQAGIVVVASAGTAVVTPAPAR